MARPGRARKSTGETKTGTPAAPINTAAMKDALKQIDIKLYEARTRRNEADLDPSANSTAVEDHWHAEIKLLKGQRQEILEPLSLEQAKENLSAEETQSRQMEPRQAEEDVTISSQGSAELAYKENAATKNILRRATSLNIDELNACIEAGEIIVSFQGHGFNHGNSFGYSFQATGQMSTEHTFVFAAGHIFIPENHGRTQNHVLRDELIITLKPGEKKEGKVYSFCGNLNFGCSSGGIKMALTAFALNVGTLNGQHSLWNWLTDCRMSTRRWLNADGEEQECAAATQQDEENGRAMEELADTCSPELASSIKSQKIKLNAMKVAEEYDLFVTTSSSTETKTGISGSDKTSGQAAKEVASVVNYQLSTDDALIQAEENVARALYVANREEAISKGPFWKLVNVYAELDSFRASTATSEYGSIFSHYSEYGSSRSKYAANENQDLRIEPDKADFLENFNFITGGLFTHVDWRNTFVAGGAVLAAMQRRPKFVKDLQEAGDDELDLYKDEMKYWHRFQSSVASRTADVTNKTFVEDNEAKVEKERLCYPSQRQSSTETDKFNRGHGFRKGRSRFGESDIDIFVYGLTASDATKKLIDLTEQIRRAGAEASLNPYAHCPEENAPEILAVRTENAVTYITTAIHPHLQIILRVYSAPAEILMGFDVDSCCVGFDGTNAWALPRARRAITLSANIADPARESRTYEVRLAKYAKRGFKVLTPGFQTQDVDRRIYMRPLRDLQGLARLMRLEMLDMMKVPSKLYDELGVAGTDRDYWGEYKSDPKLNNFRVFESLTDSLVKESDYSSTYFPSGPGWNACSVLENLLLGGESRTQMSGNIKYDSVGINRIGTKDHGVDEDGFSNVNVTKQGYSITGTVGTVQGYLQSNVCGNLNFILRSFASKNDFPQDNDLDTRKDWVVENPGRQYVTGSFHPLRYDWYAQALAIEQYSPSAHRIAADIKINEQRARSTVTFVTANMKQLYEKKIVVLKEQLEVALAQEQVYFKYA